ncbi:MAG: amino acid transporter rane protein [Microbacteriaceae bacterium]|nr:amino acid transporter rane protein [Microbacteriaceae bacterium]
MSTLASYFGQIMVGLGTALSLTVIGFAGALVLGTILAVFRIGPITPLRLVGTVYVEVLRNIPLLCLLILFVFGLPDIGIVFDLYTTVAICLALFNAAFVCEAIRTGINTVPVGQAEAARALGLTFTQSLRTVVLPQAFQSMIQPLVNVFIGVLLGSSLASAVGVMDLLGVAQFINLHQAWGIGLFAAAAAVYASIALGMGFLGGRLERKVAISR